MTFRSGKKISAKPIRKIDVTLTHSIKMVYVEDDTIKFVILNKEKWGETKDEKSV